MFAQFRLYLYGVIAAAVVAAFVYTYWKGHANGALSIQSKWDAAVARDITKGESDRSNAERDTPVVLTPDSMCKSEWNRAPC